jgi:Tol biopolymer transport system component
MSPEQLHGNEADARSDLFSFGCVLYETLTGKRAFEGQSAASVIAAILEREPPSIAAIAPPALDRVLSRCFAKDPEQRWQSARDLRAAVALAMGPRAPAPTPRAKPFLWIAATAVVAIVAGAALWTHWREPVPEDRALQFHVNLPAGAEFVLASAGNAISPDGRTIAFVAVSGGIAKLWFQSLDSLTARELPGTEGTTNPFWSPDSRFMGFFANGKLKRIDASGGPAAVLADAPNARGGTWTEDGTIVFTPTPFEGLQRVPAAGGTPSAFTQLDTASHEVTHRWPQFLPGGRQFLYSNSDTAGLARTYLASVNRPQERKALLESHSAAHYVRPRLRYPGYLLWVRQGSVIAQAFDPDRGQLSGEPQPVPGAESVAVVGTNYHPGFSVSNSGTILANTGSDLYRLSWLSRDGKVLSSPWQPGGYAGLRISPDGARAALSVMNPSGGRDVWTLDFARGVQTRVVASGTGPLAAIWSPDGRKIVYYRPLGTTIFQRDASGAGSEEPLLESTRLAYAEDFSPDGHIFMYDLLEDDGSRSFWLLPYPLPGGSDRKPVLYLKSTASASNAQFSPDGKWVTYTDRASGQPEIYVQSFPTPDTRVQVSNGGGNFARWRRDGKELFYLALDGKLMAAAVRSAGHALEFSTPAALFRLSVPTVGDRFYPYDVAADGRILTLVPERSESAPLTVLINWQALLKKGAAGQ